MFQTVELGQKVSKADYADQVPELRTRLLGLQRRLAQANFSVVIVIAGVEGAGKSETVNLLNEWFDPRFLSTHAFERLTREERMRPPYWRFWLRLPPRGRIGIFFGSWYTEPIVARTFGETSAAQLNASMARANQFERGLVRDGTLVLKFWFHLSKKQQKKRLAKLSKDPAQMWRITRRDREHFKKYDEFRAVSEHALGLTTTADAPWNLVESNNWRFRNLSVARKLASELEAALQAAERRPERSTAVDAQPRIADKTNAAGVGPMKTILSTVDLSQRADEADYPQQLEELQARFGRACRRLAISGRSALIAFEGWDAAGKGGVIRRLTAAMDARHYSIVPVAAPSDEERARHYLWRFWRHIPGAGRVVIFDRSWYGRVLVERVEGFATEEEWSRAYEEINAFERQLTEQGLLVAKFWLHVDQEEQLRRFREREATPWKRHKITPEDWRNREKWDAYELAVHDMVEKTSSLASPWTLVPSNDKKFARLSTLERLCERLESTLA